MRQIKFRGKRVDNGEWVYGDYFKTPLTDENSGLPPDSGWFFLTGKTNHCIGQDGVAFVVDPATVSQFTGLLDKNGKEIYEGDILFCHEYDSSDCGHRIVQTFKNAVVGFSDGNYCYYPKGNMKQPHQLLMYAYNPEIIGNLTDNPELLNKNSI